MKMNRILMGLISALILCQSAFATAPTPDYPTIKQAQKVFPTNKQKQIHGATISVRAELNDLMAGDFVTTVVVYAKAGQAGAQLQLIADKAVVGTVNLPSSFSEVGFKLNMRNGQDYKGLYVRSIGKTEIQVLTVNVGDPNADTNLPPLPPPPVEPPFVQPPPIIQPILPPQGPVGLNEFSANCKTRSRGVTFFDQTEGGAIWYCRNAVNSAYQTVAGECDALAECKNPRMQCSTSSNGIPVIAYSLQSVIAKCQAHPQSNPSECANFARCEGSNNGPFPPTPPPQPIQQCPMNAFDPFKPCQTKSNGCKFSSMFLDSVIDQCQQFSPFTTNAEECRTVAFCNGNQGQFPPPPPFPGDGHIGPLPGGHQIGQCRTGSKGLFFEGPTRDYVVNICKANAITINSECEANVNPGCGFLVPGPGHGNNSFPLQSGTIFPIPSNGPFQCESTNNRLLDRNFNVVFDFADINSCQEANLNISIGKAFCNYNDNTLYKPNGELIYDFSTKSDCEEAIERVSQGRRFCDYNDNTLRESDGTLLFDYGSKQDCQAGLN